MGRTCGERRGTRIRDAADVEARHQLGRACVCAHPERQRAVHGLSVVERFAQLRLRSAFKAAPTS